MEESAIKAGADGPVSLADCKDLVKRKLLTKVVTTSFNLTKGSRFTLDVKKHITGKLRLPAKPTHPALPSLLWIFVLDFERSACQLTLCLFPVDYGHLQLTTA